MNATTRLLLPEDVALAPVAGLPEALGSQVAVAAGDFYVTRAHTRAGSIIVDAQTAALLAYFRTPTTVLEAVIAFADANALDAMATLEAAFATLTELTAARVLVGAESVLAQPIASSLPVALSVHGMEILEPIYILDDTEVYRCRCGDGAIAALKIAGADQRPNTTATIVHEASVLSLLDGAVNARLLAAGRWDGRAYIVTAWQHGVDLYRAGAEARALPEPGRSVALLALTGQVLRAYAQLHAQGALHGDVHPRNMVVDDNNAMTLLDFGLARLPAAGVVGFQGGLDLFQAPEIARANLDASAVPAPSIASEQYSIAAMLYLLLTGGHTQAFSLQQKAMLRQVVEQATLPFSHHGASQFAALESWLARALAKDPAQRYASIAAMLQAFQQACEARRDAPAAAPPPRHGDDTPSQRLQDVVLARYRVPGALYRTGLDAPTASVTYGAAGIAYFLLRMARSRNDEALLADADLWLTRAAAAIASPAAFFNAGHGVVPEILGRSSLFHHACGIHCVQALIAHARGDDAAQQQAVAAYGVACERCDQVDVAFGRAGLLLGCAMLLDIAAPHHDSHALRALGTSLLQRIWTELDAQPALGRQTSLTTLGAAHGWCGYLYASLRWCQACDNLVPASLATRLTVRLAQLADLGSASGRGMLWPRKIAEPAASGVLSASWCNGAAGYVHLWTTACQLLGANPAWERLARMAAWHACDGYSETRSDSASVAPGDLCCGLAGRAYALLRLYRHSGDAAWLGRAQLLGQRAVAHPGIAAHRMHSLLHGDIGIALLSADLDAPAFAGMPFFEGEHWQRRAPAAAAASETVAVR